MAMVVKNNMSAVNTLNTLNANSAALAKSLAKVSSGQKINSAADDASGYAISERMRVMVRSLDQADQNAQNGASMMKVAEGAVGSTVEILKTMKEKAINAANDSNTDADRQAIQKELDQSIDQIDDNALITYNGKTLVDGSKHTKGVATRNTFSNQSLSENTKADTKLIDLADRNGQGLNIQTTDTLTISYVIQGRMYSMDIDIDESTTLQDALDKAAEPYFDNSPLGKVINSTYNSSVHSAEVVHSTTVANATTTYHGSIMSVEAALNAAKAAKVAAQNNLASAQQLLNTAASTANTLSTSQGWGSVSTSDLDPNSSSGVRNWSFNATGTLTNPTGAITGIYTQLGSAIYSAVGTAQTALTAAEADLTAAQAAYNAVEQPARSTMNSSIAVADSVKSTAIKEAKETRDESLGEMLPYRPTIGETSEIGKDFANDTVYTANRENAITITAASRGTDYQLSGITFSVTDSKGQVKKSVNAVLDAFSETIHASNKSNDNAINLQVGTKANQTIRISLDDMRSEALGLKASDGVTLSVSTQKHANAAINVLDNALQKALDQQTDIGAVQARLEMTSQNLVTSSQNVQASESVIRDADMAKEMTEFTKNNVLLQAAQSMLAQANQSSSSVLSLLQ